jgi:hypothetical protein
VRCCSALLISDNIFQEHVGTRQSVWHMFQRVPVRFMQFSRFVTRCKCASKARSSYGKIAPRLLCKPHEKTKTIIAIIIRPRKIQTMQLGEQIGLNEQSRSGGIESRLFRFNYSNLCTSAERYIFHSYESLNVFRRCTSRQHAEISCSSPPAKLLSSG